MDQTPPPLDADAVQRLQTIVAAVDASPLVVFLWRVAEGWPVEYVSRSVSQFGYSADDFLSGRLAWPAVTHPDDVPRLEAEVAFFRKENILEFHQEYRLLTKFGEVRWVDDRTFAVHDASGRLTHYAGAIRDITNRKLAETVAHQEHAQLLAMIESCPRSVYAVDRAYRYTCFNRAHVANMKWLYGVDISIGDNIINCHRMEPDSRQARLNLDRALRGEFFTLEWIMRKDGEVDATQATYSPIHGEGGAIVGVSVFHRDISELRRAMDEIQLLNAELEKRVNQRTALLSESEERYRLLFSSQAAAAHVFDDETLRIVDVNEAALALYGYTQEEFLSRTALDLSAEPAKTESAIRGQRTTGRGLVMSGRHRKKDGTEFPCEISGSLFRLRGRVVWCSLVRDCTQERTAERLIRESESKFRSLAEQSPNMIFINMQGRVVYANPKSVELMGYSLEDVSSPAFNFMTLIAPESVDLVRTRVMEKMRGIEHGSYEMSLLTKSGRRIDTILSSRLIEYEGARAILGIMVDITERKQAERIRMRQQERLQRLAAKLAQAQDEEQRRIADGLHDDVAQVLAACRFQLASIRSDKPVSDQDRLRAELDSLIADAQQKIRTLSFELSSSTLQGGGLEASVAALCKSMEHRYNIRFEYHGPDVPSPLGEEAVTVLFKAARELLFNVVKHAGVDSASVTVDRTPRGVRVQVMDCGRGFPSSQGGATLSRGLGLHALRERLRDIGGSLTVESVPGVRTRVTVLAPLSDDSDSPVA